MPSVQLAHNFYFSFNTLINICSRNGFKLIRKAVYNTNDYLMFLFERQNNIEKYNYNYATEKNNILKIYQKFRIKTFFYQFISI